MTYRQLTLVADPRVVATTGSRPQSPALPNQQAPPAYEPTPESPESTRSSSSWWSAVASPFKKRFSRSPRSRHSAPVPPRPSQSLDTSRSTSPAPGSPSIYSTRPTSIYSPRPTSLSSVRPAFPIPRTPSRESLPGSVGDRRFSSFSEKGRAMSLGRASMGKRPRVGSGMVYRVTKESPQAPSLQESLATAETPKEPKTASSSKEKLSAAKRLSRIIHRPSLSGTTLAS